MSSASPEPATAVGVGVPYPGGELGLFERAIRWKRYVRRQLARYVRGRVLEVGAGIGATTEAFVDGLQESWTCLEPDAEFAAALRRRFTGGLRGVPVSVHHGTTDELADRDRFDCVLYIDVLEHIDDDAAELRRASRLLAPSGAVVALSPAWQWLYSRFDEHVGHRRRYSPTSLRAVTPAELSLERVWLLDSAGLFASLGNRLWLSQALPSPRQLRVWDRGLVTISRVVDPVFRYRIGKSIAAVWRQAAR